MKTILVVDDSAICREPMAAILRLQGFQTLEAANGLEALQIARTRKPELILLDVTMPVMDGLACLEELRACSSTAHIPVLMLTATSEREVILRAAQKGIAGFLLKSNFSAAELIARVQSVLGVLEARPNTQPASVEVAPRHQTAPGAADAGPGPESAEPPTPAPAPTRRLTKSAVLQRITHEIELRSVKPVLEYVIALTRSSTCTVDDIASAIRQDQALALRILRVANSSFYQRSRGAKNLTEATQRIGMTAVRNTVIAILAIDHFEQATESGLIPQRFWEHSLATAVLAEMIGDEVSARQTDQLFLAGLLHDVGRMVLGSIYPEDYATVLARAAEQELDLETVEQEIFELSHVDATRHLLCKWSLPPSIVEAASLHESRIGKLRMVKQDAQSILTVALANRMAHALVLGNSGNARLLPYYEFASELGLDNDAIGRIATAALQKATDMELFYTAQSNESFCGPLAGEFKTKAGTAPRIAVLGPDSPADPFSLFFKQVGWLQAERPTAAMIAARSHVDYIKYLPALRKLDADVQGAVAVIAATTDGTIRVPAEWSCGRRLETISLPCSYSRLVDTVIRCGGAVAPIAATATGR